MFRCARTYHRGREGARRNGTAVAEGHRHRNGGDKGRALRDGGLQGLDRQRRDAWEEEGGSASGAQPRAGGEDSPAPGAQCSPAPQACSRLTKRVAGNKRYWSDKSQPKDFKSAVDYLSLLIPRGKSKTVGQRLKKAPIIPRAAEDLFCARGFQPP